MRSKVALVYCDSYEEEKVYEAMKAGIAAIGGLESFIKPEERILVKPNFLTASDPEKAVITHPSVIRAMLRMLHEYECENVVCGDSPGHGSPEAAAARIDLQSMLTEYKAVLADMSTEVSVDYPEGVAAKQFYFTKAASESEAIIGLCKMKTHALERITGAVKNFYGLICGYRKAAGHVKYPNAGIFARMLVDIHKCTSPRFHVMDGILAMEGNGPGSGDPVKMNVLLFSADPVAMDAVYCRLIDLDPELVPTNVQGEALGLGSYHFDNIEIIEINGSSVREINADEAFAAYGKADFDVDRKGVKKSLLGRVSDISAAFSKRPYIDKKLCVKCGVCVDHCPVPGKAVDFKRGRDKIPVYDYRKCIRCYCCQEMCPQKAIKVKGI